MEIFCVREALRDMDPSEDRDFLFSSLQDLPVSFWKRKKCQLAWQEPCECAWRGSAGLVWCGVAQMLQPCCAHLRTCCSRTVSFYRASAWVACPLPRVPTLRECIFLLALEECALEKRVSFVARVRLYVSAPFKQAGRAAEREVRLAIEAGVRSQAPCRRTALCVRSKRR